ncbi:hydrolase [Streptomyces fumigatiscleroticus]|nr:hydrolase [Streptomyces fumigatiscleroticus]
MNRTSVRHAPATPLLLASVLAAGCLVSCSADEPPVRAAIRVNQAGYVTGEKKYAYVMGDGDELAGAGFTVLDAGGRTVLRGRLGASAGEWNSAYDTVRTADLSALTRPGTYRVHLTGTDAEDSPRFRVAPAEQLMAPLLKDGVAFFRTQRDGEDVLSDTTGRVASHLTDERAVVYESPHYDSAAERMTDEKLTRAAGPVDVSGGWFDAGDYLKFTSTASYAVGQMLTAVRDAPAVPGLPDEAEHGLSWLDKMWDEETGTLYAQVGLGAGNDDVRDDHDVWRLPEEDDGLTVRPGDRDYFLKYRPVFRAGEPGEPISPNLAGRVAAAFALAAQTRAEEKPDEAREWLERAADVYAQADTTPKASLVTTFPASFYREDAWQDDMEWAAVELARAAGALDDDRRDRWNREAVSWARSYLASDTRGTLGLSDVSALAHADLLSATDLDDEVASGLEADLRRQVKAGQDRAADDPFRAGAVYTDYDAVPHTFGLVATAELYARVTGDHRYDGFAARQRAWALGANAWGTSFVVGAGTLYPHCLQHQIANLAMSRTGRGDILRGAVVNGPNKADRVDPSGTLDSARSCSSSPGGRAWSDLDGQGAAYVDDVRAWQTVEPADDFTSTALLAFALTAAGS